MYSYWIEVLVIGILTVLCMYAVPVILNELITRLLRRRAKSTGYAIDDTALQNKAIIITASIIALAVITALLISRIYPIL